jgi:altronate hydrolase
MAISTQIMGYLRSNGSIGIRNLAAVIYTAECAKLVARRIAAGVPDIQVFGRRTGCDWDEALFKRWVGMASNPNLGSVLVVGAGCEHLEAQQLVEAISGTGKPARHLVISQTGGTIRSITRGRELLREVLSELNQAPRVEMTVRDLVVGVDCGVSDATSGIASNPAVGAAADLLIAEGATVYLFNIKHEMIGMGDALAGRAISPAVARALRDECPQEVRAPLLPIFEHAGITTYREVAVGALAKGGSSPIMGVIKTFEKPSQPGLYLQVFPEGSNEGECDIQDTMAMAAAGAHIVVRTIGGGSVVGGIVTPVIKVCANPNTIALLGEDIDIDASGILKGTQTVEEAGRIIFQVIIDVAAGKQTKAEMFDYNED